MMLGERLKMARAMSQLSMRALAERACMSHQAVAKYEAGTVTPSSSALIRLAEALGVRIEFLMRPLTVQLSEAKFRKKSTLGSKARKTIEAKIRDRIERYITAEALLDLSNDPPCSTFGAQDLDDDKIEELAERWRNDWKLGDGPIENLIEAAESNGIRVVLVDAPAGFDGCAVWINNKIPAVVINQSLFECRFRLTLAHELAHILARSIDGLDGKTQERLVFRLGAAFLVPREVAYAELGRLRRSLDWDELSMLKKKKYGLSIAAWIMRAHQLNIISKDSATRLFRELGRRGWRRTEPGDKRTTERSHRLQRLLLRAVSEGIVSEARAEEIYGQSLREDSSAIGERQDNASRIDH